MTDTRGSVFVSDAPDSRLPSTSPAAPAAPVSIGDIVQAHARLGYQDFAGAPQQAEIDAYGPIVTALSDHQPVTRYVQIGGGMPVNTNAVWQDVAARRLTDPSFLKDIPAEDASDFSAYVKGQELQRRHTAQDVVSRQQGLVQNATGFATDIGVGLADPINLSAMILTAGGGGAVNTLARGMAREAMVNGAIGVAQLPTQIQNRANYGEAMSPMDMAESVGMAALTGAAFHGGVHVVGAAGAALKARLSTATDAEVANHFEQAVAPDQRTPDEQAAVHVMGRETDIDAANPYIATPAGRQAHADNLGNAISDILARGNPDATPSAVSRETPSTASAASPDLSPDRVIRFVMGPLEGGARVVHYGEADGGTTKFGIAAKFNPGVDVANLSANDAAAIARRKYWLPEYDRADPRTAAVAFDAGYIAGPDEGRRILRESGGDPNRALELYRGYLDNLADTHPAKAKYREGWNNRLDKLQRFVGGSEDRATLRPDGFPDGDALDLAQHDLDQADMDQQMLDQEARMAPAPEAIAPQQGDAVATATEGSGVDPATYQDQPVSPIADVAAQPVDAQPMAAPRPPSIAAPDSPVVVRPETRVALRDYASDRGNSLAVTKVASALGIEPAEARGALEMLAARADGTLIQRGNGSFTRRAVRRAPVDLNRFLSDRGGLRDTEGHDLVGGRNLQKFVPASGMLIRKGGMSLDGAREAAAEAGYFHQHGTPDEAIAHTTTADFLDLLEHAHDTPHFALADLGEADRLAHSKSLAKERGAIKDVIDARLGEQGFEFDKAQIRRAAELVQEHGFTHEQAIIHTINEEFADVIDGSTVEAEKDQYERAAHDAESAYAGDDRRGEVRDDGSGSVAGDARQSGQGDEELQRPDRGGNAVGDEREADGLAGPPPLHDTNIERFSDPVGEGARAVAASIEHDVRAGLDRGAEVDPAIAERERQQAQLKADGPMRARADQDSTIGSPLFDAVDQQQFRLDENGADRAAADILKEIDSDQAAIAAARNCL